MQVAAGHDTNALCSTLILGTQPFKCDVKDFFNVLHQHFPNITNIVVQSRQGRPVAKNWRFHLIEPQRPLKVLEVEVPPSRALAIAADKGSKPGKKWKVGELRMRESAGEVCMMMDLRGTHKVISAYRGIESLALDFGFDKGAVEPNGKKTLFAAVQTATLPDLKHLILRFEPCFDPSAQKAQPFPVSQAYLVNLDADALDQDFMLI